MSSHNNDGLKQKNHKDKKDYMETGAPGPSGGMFFGEASGVSSIEDLRKKRRALAQDYYEQAFSFITDSKARQSKIEDALKGINFDEPVEVVVLPKGMLLQQKQGYVWSKGNYYSDIGTTPTEVGISDTGNAPQGLPKVFTTREFRKEFDKIRKSPIQRALNLGRELEDKELNDLQEENVRNAKVVAIQLGIEEALEKFKEEHGSITQEQIDKITKGVTETIQGLPMIQWGGEFRKAMRVYEVGEDVAVLRSKAGPISDTWSLSAQGKSVPTKGGSIQYFCTKQDVFKPRILTEEEYLSSYAEKQPKSRPKP